MVSRVYKNEELTAIWLKEKRETLLASPEWQVRRVMRLHLRNVSVAILILVYTLLITVVGSHGMFLRSVVLIEFLAGTAYVAVLWLQAVTEYDVRSPAALARIRREIDECVQNGTQEFRFSEDGAGGRNAAPFYTPSVVWYDYLMNGMEGMSNPQKKPDAIESAAMDRVLESHPAEIRYAHTLEGIEKALRDGGYDIECDDGPSEFKFTFDVDKLDSEKRWTSIAKIPRIIIEKGRNDHPDVTASYEDVMLASILFPGEKLSDALKKIPRGDDFATTLSNIARHLSAAEALAETAEKRHQNEAGDTTRAA